jgi:DDE superfamily endonuclease
MTTEPYASARRVFWIVDNGSSHRGRASVERLEGAWPNLRLIHLPIHASWLNQVEIYFSIVQRKVLTPNDFTDLAEVEHRLLGFQRRYQQTPCRSTGASPEPTSPSCSAGWTSTTTAPPRHDHHARTSIGDH